CPDSTTFIPKDLNSSVPGKASGRSSAGSPGPRSPTTYFATPAPTRSTGRAQDGPQQPAPMPPSRPPTRCPTPSPPATSSTRVLALPSHSVKAVGSRTPSTPASPSASPTPPRP